MSTIDPASQSQLDSILKKLGVNKEEEADQKNSDALGQSDFLKLMTTQLQNQDPFAPMDNTAMVEQMAQFSQVTGITEMSQTLKGIADQLSEFRIATAANMLGHSVLVPGSTAYPDSDGSVSGAIDIPAASANTNIVYRSQAGEILHTQELGAQSAGLVGFSWQDIPEEVLSQNASIKVEAYADTGKGLKSVGASVYSEVLAASTGTAASDVVYDVRGYGDVKASDVVRFKN